MTAIQHLQRISPVQATFFGSLLLSLLALLTNPVINRDGILYVETARIFLENGFAAAFRSFDWPFLPILIALVSKLSGIGLEQSGHLLNALFMAGTCTLLVASSATRQPEAAWPIALIVLALPGLNHYRDELLREYGCWFFTLLSFWFALKWADAPRWGTGLIAQVPLCIATLFRPEAVAFFAALVLWQAFEAPRQEKLRRIMMIGSLPIFGTLLIAVLILARQFSPEGRLGTVAGLFNPARKRALFDGKAKALADALIPYARDQAGTILFLGSLAIIPLKFIKQLGLFVIPLLFLLKANSLRAIFLRAPLFAWALLAHLFVLSAFIIDMQFLAGRYVAVLGLLAAPFIGWGLWQLMQRFTRWTPLILALVLIIMVGNSVSLTPRQTQFIRAGEWLAANTSADSRIYIDSTRVAYYAGWRLDKVSSPEDRGRNTDAFRQGKFDLVVFDLSSKEGNIDEWLTNYNLQLVKEFVSPLKGSVVVATRKSPL